MLKVEILALGKLKEAYWEKAVLEYEKRLSRYCRFSINEIQPKLLPESPPETLIKKALLEEAEEIRKRYIPSSYKIALCIEGKSLSSEGLAEKIKLLMGEGISTVQLIIGSSHGLDESIKKEADFQLSFSPLTFPHQLMRVMVCEQIYRAFTIMQNGKYHK